MPTLLFEAVPLLPLQPHMVTGGVCEVLGDGQFSASTAGFPYTLISNGIIDVGVGQLRACHPVMRSSSR